MEKASRRRRAEERLRIAFARGKVLDLRTGHSGRDDPSGGAAWTAERQVGADVIAELACKGNDHGISVLGLAGARVVGALDLRHARMTIPLILRDCFFEERADISEAHAPLVRLTGSRFPSLACLGLQVEGDADFSGVDSGSIDARGVRVGGRLWLQGACLHNGGSGWALNAPDLTVDSGMYCRGLRADGGVNIYGASIGSTLELREAVLANPDGPALRARGLTIRFDMSCSACSTDGEVDLFGAQVGGQLWLGGAHLNGRTRYALNAPLLKVGGGMYCNAGFSASGGVNLFGAAIGATLEFDGASLVSPGSTALRAPGCVVLGDMTCTGGFSVSGRIDMVGARVVGQLSLSRATYSDSSADLRRADIGTLSAEPSAWPDQTRLNELTYAAIEPYIPARQRLPWLRRDPDGYQPQPYEQLAAYYRRIGQDEQARTVLLAKQRHRRHRLRLPARAWGYIQDAVIGYGYRPARAFAWLALLVSVTAAYFAANPPHATSAGGPQFHPVIYAFDTVVPVLNLAQGQSWVPSGIGQWISWIASIAGWILATTVIAGITRMLTRS